MRINVLKLAVFFTAPALLWASPTGIPFGPSTTELDYGPAGALTIVGCASLCTITGAVPNPLSLPLTYAISLDIPAGLTLQGIPAGSTAMGEIELDSGTVAVTLSDALGDSLSANVGSGTWTASGDAAELDLGLVVTNATFVTPGLSALVATELGFTPVDGSVTSLTLNTSCPTTCITSADPIASIIGGTLGGSAAAAIPEPAMLALLGCGLAGVWLRSRASAYEHTELVPKECRRGRGVAGGIRIIADRYGIDGLLRAGGGFRGHRRRGTPISTPGTVNGSACNTGSEGGCETSTTSISYGGGG